MKKIAQSILILLCTIQFALSQNINWGTSLSCPASARYSTAYFSLNGKGYVCCGYDGNPSNEVWEFNPITQSWTQKGNFPGAARWSATCFTIGNKGYLTHGASPSAEIDLWEYEPTTDTWTQKADFPSYGRQDAIGFSIMNKGYVACGKAAGYVNELWEYNPATNTWAQKADFLGNGRSGISAFVIGNEGYVGLGYSNGVCYNDFYKYSPSSDSWTQISNYPGSARTSGAHFTLGNDGYVGAGYDVTNYFNNFYKFNAQTNTWSTAPSILEHNMFTYPSIFVIGDTAYLGNGRNTQLQYMTEFIKLVSSNPTSLSKTTSTSFRMYPNPSSTIVNVEIDAPENVSKIILRDVVGKSVLETNLKFNTKNQLNISKLESGTYFCQIIFNNNTTHTQKLMVIH